MKESLVRRNGWLIHQQLLDAIAVGQIIPDPILSSATFLSYLINGVSGGVLATIGIFLPSFLYPYSCTEWFQLPGIVSVSEFFLMALVRHRSQ
ncbi:chromate transporter [Pseudobacter ginsenosidimutans]|uniref:chromate transporter n=1 Tax=Pseudobacter ginsenosidimutans TaxID=661488 RepID=UPI00102DCB66|nr:hypothetical protein FSB84_00450 [Pseudobacter ginsenosidimutans]